jgi:hypothetical protein
VVVICVGVVWVGDEAPPEPAAVAACARAGRTRAVRATDAPCDLRRALAGIEAGCVVSGCVVRLASVWPWNPFAAITARPPDNATTAATMPRVIAEIRRSPASRVLIARRLANSARLSAERRGGREINGGDPVSRRRGVAW